MTQAHRTKRIAPSASMVSAVCGNSRTSNVRRLDRLRRRRQSIASEERLDISGNRA
jgi:hypothetical protein